ncbi:MAG: hypothetical protein LBE55_05375, partial [Clostridiales bacterium]|nr:hypothetical protein [Clostridiales bacterium]
MRLRNRKIFTALLLVFVLAFTPMPLFASVWENEGAALKSQLVELLGEMRAQWIISDIELDIEHGHLDDETLEKVLSMDILEYLAEHLTPRELEEFLAMESADRFFLLRMDVFLTISISGWGTFGGTSVVVSDIWDNEGRALMAQLTELMGVGLTYSFVNVVDLAYENSLGQFDSDALARLLEWDIMAWLEEHKTPEELAAFMAQDNDDRYSYLFGVLSNNFLFPRQVEPRDVIGEEEIPFFSDILTFRLFEILWTNLIEPLIQEVYEADSPPAPVLSPIWENEGQALLAQLAELLGEEAVWFADYMDWLLENDHLDLATYSEILTLNLRELLAQELTQQELADFFEMDYFDRYGILAQIVVLPHLEVTWLDWAADRPRFWEEEGLALKTQLTELLGEERAVWIIDYLDWWTWTGLITDDIKAEILALDVMAALREHLAAEELKEFFGMGYFNRAWVFRESIILPMISTIDVTRENIAAVLEIVAQEHIEEFDFDIIAMLNEAGMDTDDLVEMLYFMLTAYDG